jgi:hypothetical protein
MSKHRHSPVCPCNENIKTQSKYYEKILKKCKSKKNCEDLLKKCDPCFIRYLSRGAHGILTQSIQLPEKSYKKLGSSKKSLIKLSNPNISIARKRNLLINKKGGGVIIPTLIASVIGSLISKAIQG